MPGKKKVTIRISAFVAILTTLFAFSACGGGSTAKDGGQGDADTMLLGADSGTPTFTKNFNPFSTSKRVGTNYLYEPMMVSNPVNGDLTPFLATKKTVLDPKTVEFTLREGVKWQDGSSFGAKDVVFSFNLMKKYPAIDTLGVWQRMQSIASNGNTITIKLKQDDVPAAQILGQQLIVPEHVWKNIKDPVKDTNVNPIGTGPYKVGSFSPNQYTMVKNTSYWQADKVAAKTLVLPASNTQLDVVNNGYDWAYSYMTNVEKTWATKKTNHYWFPPAGIISLYPNLTKAPFNDLNFRKGISYALDREAVAKNAEEGYMQSAGQTGLILPGESKWLSSNIDDKGIIRQDTAEALTNFEKAGFQLRDGKLVDSSGKQLEITIMTANGYTDWLRGAQTLQKQLNSVGIGIKLSQPQPAAYNQALNNGNFDMAIGGFGGSGSVFQTFNTLLNSSFATPVGTATTSNFERFKSDKADELLSQFKSATDEKAQKKIAGQLQQILYDELPTLALFYGGSWGLYSTKKFTGWPSEKDPYSLPVPYAQTALLIFTHIKKVA